MLCKLRLARPGDNECIIFRVLSRVRTCLHAHKSFAIGVLETRFADEKIAIVARKSKAAASPSAAGAGKIAKLSLTDRRYACEISSSVSFPPDSWSARNSASERASPSEQAGS